MSETMAAQTTRTVAFTLSGQVRPTTRATRLPAGTEVYAARRLDGMWAIRVCGSLLTQVVSADTITPLA